MADSVSRLVSVAPRLGRLSQQRSSRRPRCVPSALASPSGRNRRRRRALSSKRRSRSEQTASVWARRWRRRLSTRRRRSGKPSARRASTKPPLRRAFAGHSCWACCREGAARHTARVRNLAIARPDSITQLVDLDAGQDRVTLAAACRAAGAPIFMLLWSVGHRECSSRFMCEVPPFSQFSLFPSPRQPTRQLSASRHQKLKAVGAIRLLDSI